MPLGLTFGGMSIHFLIAALLAANLMTALALWGLFQLSKVAEVSDASFVALGAVLFPALYVLVCLSVFQPPSFLAALTAQ